MAVGRPPPPRAARRGTRGAGATPARVGPSCWFTLRSASSRVRRRAVVELRALAEVAHHPASGRVVVDLAAVRERHLDPGRRPGGGRRPSEQQVVDHALAPRVELREQVQGRGRGGAPRRPAVSSAEGEITGVSADRLRSDPLPRDPALRERGYCRRPRARARAPSRSQEGLLCPALGLRRRTGVGPPPARVGPGRRSAIAPPSIVYPKQPEHLKLRACA